MPDIVSPSRSGSSLRRALGVLAAAAMWLSVVLLRIFGPDTADTASACSRMIYRDPVTGREQAIGTARIVSDGTIRCRDVSALPAPR
ncbi:hypothetical protein [Bosea sp. BIWAKO-01]|uniref:hypothetical protein n=1 Tax=Bosea sp. BIWAKO-01 TaxID=506668 RepID=UPI0008697CA5|nr:hypothetical protein [Bosea sp. BIWAKO-01]GAU86031.1 hypothetical protein BIWAKO_05979 [Bosea sp. BIWAKO-01]